MERTVDTDCALHFRHVFGGRKRDRVLFKLIWVTIPLANRWYSLVPERKIALCRWQSADCNFLLRADSRDQQLDSHAGI